MITSRRLMLSGALALAITAVAVAALRPGVRTGLARTVTNPSGKVTKGTSRHRRPASNDTTIRIVVVPAPAPTSPERAGRAAATFHRDGAAEPHSLQVVSVPVPALFGRKQVAFAVNPSGDADLLSARAGTMPAATADAERATTLVTRVPAHATAGPLEVAKVEFTDDTVTATVSVELTIARVRRIVMRPAKQSIAIYPGQRAPLDVTVQNLGNGTDTLRIGFERNNGWELDAPTRLVLLPGEQRTLNLAPRAPMPPASGVFPLILQARGDSSVVASLSVPVELLERGNATRSSGPTGVLGIATAAGDSTGSAPVLSFAVSGPLTDRVAIRGHLIQTTDATDFNTSAMARVGYFRDNSYLQASGAGWSVTGGRTGYQFSPIFGWSAYGLGGSAMLTRGAWDYNVLATSQRFAQQTVGSEFGTKIDRREGARTWSLNAVHFNEQLDFTNPGRGDRRLDAAGIGLYAQLGHGAALTADVGFRSSNVGSGVAANVEYRRQDPRNVLLFTATHAPGGSGAFAQATDATSASLWRRMTPALALRVIGYGNADDPGLGTKSNRHGAAFGPTVRVGGNSALDLTLSSNQSEFSALTGRVTTSEKTATFGALTSLGPVSLHASVGAGTLGRSTIIPSGGSFSRSGGRLIFSATAEAQTSRGIFTAQADMERNDTSTGQLSHLSSINLHASRLRVFSGPRAPTFDVSAWFSSFPGSPSVGPALRVGSEIELPGQFSLLVDAERNPYITLGSAKWVAAFRLQRSFGLPGVQHPAAQGSVFEDRNGNGVRDADEPGLGGVLVRRGSQSMLTRPDGSFRFYDPSHSDIAPAVDVAALPDGQMTPPSVPVPSAHNWQLPVARTSRLRVLVNAAVDSLGRVPMTTPNMLTVVAADSSGAVWTAHPDSAGRVSFDALPAGRYTLTLDFTGSSERLRMKFPPAVVLLVPGQEIEPVRIPYGFRATRVFDGSAGSPGGRRK